MSEIIKSSENLKLKVLSVQNRGKHCIKLSRQVPVPFSKFQCITEKFNKVHTAKKKKNTKESSIGLLKESKKDIRINTMDDVGHLECLWYATADRQTIRGSLPDKTED